MALHYRIERLINDTHRAPPQLAFDAILTDLIWSLTHGFSALSYFFSNVPFRVTMPPGVS